MEMDLEINSIRRLEKFIKRVSENKEVWGLESDDGWFVCESNEYEDTLVMLFWSDRAYAQQCKDQHDLSEYHPAVLDLDEFIEQWLEGLDQDGLLVGLNWSVNLIGKESEPMDIAEALEEELL